MSETPSSSTESKPAAPRRRRGRRWLIGIGIVLLILIALVIFAPTIASTSPVRRFVVGRINDQLNGRVEIDDWSLGWNQGITASGIQVYGPENELILEVPRVVTELTLLEAVRGNFDIGETQVEVNLTQVIIDEEGVSNYQKLVKSEPEPKPEPKTTQEPSPLPDVRGKVTINIKGGTIAGKGVATPVHLQPGSIVATIPSINDAIENSIELSYRVGHSSSISRVKTAGSVDLFENNQPAMASMKLKQNLELADVDLSAIAPFIQSKEQDATPMRLEGIANGKLDVNATGLADATAAGSIVIANFVFAGGPLEGDDAFTTQQITIPVQVTQSGEGDAAVLNIEKLSIEMPEGSISVAGKVPQAAITNVLANKPPGHEGQITVTTNIPKLAEIANQLDDTFGLAENVRIDSGNLTETFTINFTAEQTSITQHAELAASGTRDNQRIELSPIVLDARATMVPGAIDRPEFRDLNLKLASNFATINGEGESLAKLHVHGNTDLDKLNQELRQFSDLGGAAFAGRAEFDVTSSGDVTDLSNPINVKANVQDVRVSMPQQQLDVVAAGIDVKTSGSYAGKTLSISSPLVVDLTQLTVRKAGEPIVRDETVHLAVAGDVVMQEALTTATLSQLELTTSSKLFTVQKSEPDLVITMPEGGAITGQGQVTIAADLPRLNQVAGAFGGKPLVAELTSGQLDGTVELAQAQGGAGTVTASLDISQLTIGDYLQNEQIDVEVRAKVPADFSKLDEASADVNSAFATIKLSDASLLLAKTDQPAKPLDQLQQAKLVVNVPNLPKVYALIDALQPEITEQPVEGAEPAPPLQVLRGSAVATIDVSQKGGSTQFEVSELRVSQLALARGDTTYQMPEDVNLTLSAAADAKEIRINSLAGDLGIAQLSMPQPIVLSNLGTDQLSAQGAIKLDGKLDAALPLVAVLQGATEQLPYHGGYSVTQNITSDAGRLALKGEVAIDNFRVVQNEQELFAEPRIEIANDIALEPEAGNLLINSLRLSMPQTQAVQLSASGRINDFKSERKFEKVLLVLDYDLEKLLPILKPMLGPDFEDLKLAGKYSQQFNVSGSYPAKDEAGKELAFHESIRTVTASGAVGIGLLDWQGAHLENYLLPISLEGGKLATIHADKPKDQRHPAPGSFNGGTIDLGGIVVDLTRETPRLSIGKNQKLLNQVTLNPLLADKTLGKFVNPAFVNPQEARGLVDLTIIQCENLALGKELTSADSGRLEMNLSIVGVTLGNELIAKIAVFKPNAFNQSFLSGSIENAKIAIENGRLVQDLTIEVNDKYPLKFEGAVRLADQKLDPMFVTIPAGLIEQIQEKWLKYVPDGIRVPIRGYTNKWELPLADAVTTVVQDIAKRALLEELTGAVGGSRREEPPAQEARPGDPAPPRPATRPAPRPGEDLPGTLIDIFQKKLDSDREKKEKRKQ